jgi:hypothetical protein
MLIALADSGLPASSPGVNDAMLVSDAVIELDTWVFGGGLAASFAEMLCIMGLVMKGDGDVIVTIGAMRLHVVN